MHYQKAASAALLMASAVALIGLQLRPWGWLILLASALSLLVAPKKFAKDMLLIHISLAILGLTPITTDISYGHFAVMGLALTSALLIPYAVSRWIYRDYRVRFRFHHGRKWYKTEVFYVAVSAVVGYLLIPFYLIHTGAYLNWPSGSDSSSLLRLFAGTNMLAIWDELFFISTVLGLLRHHFKFVTANLMQAVMFTSFLYELGFRGWGPIMIFGFAILQGYVFKKTESLFYVITIHLTVDLVLFAALVHAHHPGLFNIFIS